MKMDVGFDINYFIRTVIFPLDMNTAVKLRYLAEEKVLKYSSFETVKPDVLLTNSKEIPLQSLCQDIIEQFQLNGNWEEIKILTKSQVEDILTNNTDLFELKDECTN